MDQFITKSYAKGGKKMPMVNGKKYPYTKAGKAAAKKAAAKKTAMNTKSSRPSGSPTLRHPSEGPKGMPLRNNALRPKGMPLRNVALLTPKGMPGMPLRKMGTDEARRNMAATRKKTQTRRRAK